MVDLEDFVLGKLTNADVEKIPKAPVCNKAFIYRVIDGDTFEVVYMHGGLIPSRINLRIIGLDTPEQRTSNALEKKAAYKASEYAERLVLGKVLEVSFQKWDKFGGRVDASVTLEDGNDYTKHMVDLGYAKSYHGEVERISCGQMMITIIFCLCELIVRVNFFLS